MAGISGSPESLVTDLMAFLDSSPTAFHATSVLLEKLKSMGFEMLDESSKWGLEPGGRYVMSRNGSAVAAFVLGSQPVCETGARILGAHTDSPALKLKPNGSGASGGYVTLGLEVYGGPVLATWLDRDLVVAGRVVVSDSQSREGIATRLLVIDSPKVTIPGLAIHLDRKVNDEGLMLNAQDNLPALLAMDGEQAAPAALVDLIADRLDVEPRSVLAHDLVLMDSQPAALAGRNGAFLRSGRLDDLAMCHALVEALRRTLDTDMPHSRLLLFYDNEEVGSATPQGAVSTMLPDVLERIVLSYRGGREEMMRTLSRSLLVSADMAHALNPNHAGKHDDRHRPLLNAGPVLKLNASMRYATDATGWALFERACAAADVPVQRYVNRSDIPAGSTIGPIASSRWGLKTIDVGNPMLSMHSVRETVGTRDHVLMVRALAAFLGDA